MFPIFYSVKIANGAIALVRFDQRHSLRERDRIECPIVKKKHGSINRRMNNNNNMSTRTMMMSQKGVNHHFLRNVDPSCINLPGSNWGYHEIDDDSLVFCELIMATGPETARIRKHIHVNLSNGVCTSYVMDRKISDTDTIEIMDVERCIEELHMMYICIGGPPATEFSPIVRTNSRVDTFGNWRHNSCKIVTAWADLSCNACESLKYELNQLERTNKKKLDPSNEKKKSNKKRVLINSLSHRKQSQIKALRRRRTSWYRKKKNAEREMKMIADMIDEIAEEPEQKNHDIVVVDVDDDCNSDE